MWSSQHSEGARLLILPDPAPDPVERVRKYVNHVKTLYCPPPPTHGNEEPNGCGHNELIIN